MWREQLPDDAEWKRRFHLAAAGGQSEKSVLPPQLTCRGEQRRLPDPSRSLDQQQGVPTAGGGHDRLLDPR